MTLVVVLITKNKTRQIPNVRVIRHLFKGTTIDILINVRSKETAETKSAGDVEK